jgi:hypothetical protein
MPISSVNCSSYTLQQLTCNGHNGYFCGLLLQLTELVVDSDTHSNTTATVQQLQHMYAY